MKDWKDANISGKHSREHFIRRLFVCYTFLGLLIPMQSRLSDLIEFGLKIRGDCGFSFPTDFDEVWEWELDQQIVSNMYLVES